MSVYELGPGDMIFAATIIANDGDIPGLAEDAVLAQPGTRGMLVNTGYLEDEPDRQVFLVRFEDAAGELGPPVGCWPEELSDQPPGDA